MRRANISSLREACQSPAPGAADQLRNGRCAAGRTGGSLGWAAGAVAAAALALSCKANITGGDLADLYKDRKEAKKGLTEENEYYLGRSVATRLLADAGYRYRDPEGFASGQLGPMTAYVNAVGSVVAFAALDTPRKGDRPAPLAGWHFVVLEDDTINAYAAPGGFVFVTTGAVRNAGSEDELAAILAHEVAHVVRGHAIGSIQESRKGAAWKKFFDNTVEMDPAAQAAMVDVFGGSIDDIVDGVTVKGYSKDTEFEADRVGLAILAQAGYDPSALVRYLAALEAHQDTGSGGFYQTHPKASDRIAKLDAEAKKLKLAAEAVPARRVERFLDATADLRQ